MASTPQEAQNAAGGVEAPQKEVVVLSAFESIFDVYPDKATLSKALEKAKSKVRKLRLLIEDIALRATTRRTCYSTIISELNRLLENFEPDHEDLDYKSRLEFGSTNKESIREIVAAIKHSAEKSEPAVRSTERSNRVTADHEEARRFVKMLEAASVVQSLAE